MSRSQRPLALVTGASSGIGELYARRLAQRGHDLILVARRADRLERLGKELSTEHGNVVEAVVADLSSGEGLARVVDRIAATPALDLLVNNAGISRLGTAAELSPDKAHAQITLNIIAPTRLVQAALPAMIERGKGTIVNIASALSFHGYPGAAVYSGTKSYLLTFARAVQGEVAGTGIRIQTVLPASVATELYESAGMALSDIPAELVMSAEDMVEAAFAGLDRGEEITLPSVEDGALWERYDAAREALFNATQCGRMASRYRTPDGTAGASRQPGGSGNLTGLG